MPDSDDSPLGEERRLFYVARSRARRGVAMFTARGLRSTFLTELEADGAVVITDVDGAAIEEEHCPACKQGVMVPRTGPYGDFQSCSHFPYCLYKPRQRRQA
jgi:DNA helicase-4